MEFSDQEKWCISKHSHFLEIWIFDTIFLGVKQCWSPKTFFLTKSYFKRLCRRHYLPGRWKGEELTAYQLWQILHLCEFQAFEKYRIKNKIPQNFPSTHHRIHILSIILFMVVMWLGSGVVNEHWNIKKWVCLTTCISEIILNNSLKHSLYCR